MLVRRLTDSSASVAERARPTLSDRAPDAPHADPVGPLKLGCWLVHAAKFATVRINPSRSEFQDGGVLLTGPGRRLATTESIGAEPGRPLTADQARSVVADCNRYFTRNPYRRWFSPLDRLLTAAAGVSYYDGTACHLDLIQWATEPVWAQLRDPTVQRLLIEEGRPHLRRLLEESTVRVVLLNGRAVLNQMTAAELCRLHEVKPITMGRTTCWLYHGERGGMTYVGWSTNLRRDGPDLPWRVIATTRARTIRKVIFSNDRNITGWNCYLTKPLPRPATL
jgi:hypothetical protein